MLTRLKAFVVDNVLPFKIDVEQMYHDMRIEIVKRHFTKEVLGEYF